MLIAYRLSIIAYKMNVIQLALDFNAPPGLVHPLFVENYDWVDNRLRELYYEYDLSDEMSVNETAEQEFISYTSDSETITPFSMLNPTNTPEVYPTEEPNVSSTLFPTYYDIENQYYEPTAVWDIEYMEDYQDQDQEYQMDIEDWEDYDEGYDSY